MHRNLRAEDTIHCVVYEHGTVVVRNPGRLVPQVVAVNGLGTPGAP